jgi:hypothetical protein
MLNIFIITLLCPVDLERVGVWEGSSLILLLKIIISLTQVLELDDLWVCFSLCVAITK